LPLRKDKKEYYDRLQWWKGNEKKYPVVAALAQFFLCIPASSAPPERLWSRTSKVLSLKRANMSKDIESGMVSHPPTENPTAPPSKQPTRRPTSNHHLVY
jgi:hypothetical protein